MNDSRPFVIAALVAILIYGLPSAAQHTEHSEEAPDHASRERTEEHAAVAG